MYACAVAYLTWQRQDTSTNNALDEIENLAVWVVCCCCFLAERKKDAATKQSVRKGDGIHARVYREREPEFLLGVTDDQ
jgi:hypothetical protein